MKILNDQKWDEYFAAHMDQLRQYIRQVPTNTQANADETLEQLQQAIEELHVAEQELRIQNNDLLEARNEVEQAQARYRELFDFAPDAYLVTDVAGIIRAANLAAQDMLHIPRANLIGKPLAVYVDPQERRSLRSLVEQHVEQMSGHRCELHLQPRGGGRLRPK